MTVQSDNKDLWGQENHREQRGEERSGEMRIQKSEINKMGGSRIRKEHQELSRKSWIPDSSTMDRREKDGAKWSNGVGVLGQDQSPETAEFESRGP